MLSSSAMSDEDTRWASAITGPIAILVRLEGALQAFSTRPCTYRPDLPDRWCLLDLVVGKVSKCAGCALYTGSTLLFFAHRGLCDRCLRLAQISFTGSKSIGCYSSETSASPDLFRSLTGVSKSLIYLAVLRTASTTLSSDGLGGVRAQACPRQLDTIQAHCQFSLEGL